TAEELASQVDDRTSCICYFGGDPTPQIVHALEVSRIARSRARGKIVRICWETNGSMNPRLLDRAAELSLSSGGCVKFDLKAWDEGVHRALTGVSNTQTLANFRRLCSLIEQRLDPPLLIASTLMVPRYIDEEEVRGIARFISQCNPSIPYALLAFHPQFFFSDLPHTSRTQAERCLRAAQEMGLQRVRIGNVHLLW
ncbi:MAG: radical SAM protein, partial [Candidatus Aminicenantes bacterium]|nr:radical SAM protein [Candidatus Aminicenantes bacterium]